MAKQTVHLHYGISVWPKWRYACKDTSTEAVGPLIETFIERNWKMKILKGNLHVKFEDLGVGETFLHGESPHLKVSWAFGGKVTPDTMANHVNLESGVLYNAGKDMVVEKVELGITGLERPEFGEQ